MEGALARGALADRRRLAPRQLTEDPAEGVVVPVRPPLLEGDDGVVRDVDVLRTDLLAEKALDALAELLAALDVPLHHTVRPVWFGWARLERGDLAGHLEVERHVRHEVLDQRKRLDGGGGDGLARA